MKITTNNMHEFTDQQVFDYVADHLLTQGKKSLASEDFDAKCLYRSDEGLMCAAGCLISDERYDEVFEGLSWSQVAEELGVTSTHLCLVCDLQDVHDDGQPEQWLGMLEELAGRQSLNTNALEAFKP